MKILIHYPVFLFQYPPALLSSSPTLGKAWEGMKGTLLGAHLHTVLPENVPKRKEK
jgi:hypothetical protein